MRRPIVKNKLEQLQQQNIIVKFIDIHSQQEYEKLHVPAAINIPSEKLGNNFSLFSKTDTIVCVCNHGKERSQCAAEMLYTLGYINTFYLEDGMAGWFSKSPS